MYPGSSLSSSATTEPLVINDLPGGLAFLSRLPLANPAQAEVQLNRFLNALLASPPPLPTFLSLLEQTRVPLCIVEDELIRRYTNISLPLGENEERAFQQAIATWQKVSQAYASCAQLDTDTDDPEYLPRTALILHRCIYYKSLVIVEHHRARRELCAGVWKELHDFYSRAELLNIATWPLADTLDPHGRATHCAAAFAAAMLTELSGAYSLSVRHQSIVRRWARQWAPLVSIVKTVPSVPLPEKVINLQRDAALTPATECLETDTLRQLDSSRLAQMITQVRQQLWQKTPPAQLDLGEDCSLQTGKRLLEHVFTPWSQSRTPRKFRRHASSGSARVATGFEAMHYHISGREFTQPSSAHIYSRLEFEVLFAFRDMENTSVKFHAQQNYRPPEVDVWEVFDQSAAGFRLSRSVVGHKLAYNQLIALCPPDGGHFFLAQVSWLMQKQDNGLVVGLAALPGSPSAVAARVMSAGATVYQPYERAFLLPAVPTVGEPPSIVLPEGWFQPARIIEIHTDKLWRLRLDLLLQSGPGFERISYILEEVN